MPDKNQAKGTGLLGGNLTLRDFAARTSHRERTKGKFGLLLETRTEFLRQKKAAYERQKQENNRRNRNLFVVAGVCILFLGISGYLLGDVWMERNGGSSMASADRQTQEDIRLRTVGLENDKEQSEDSVKYVVPDVVKFTSKRARKSLTNSFLAYRLTYRYDQTIKKGNVISQSVPAGKLVEKGHTVVLTISRGKKSIAKTTDGSGQDEEGKLAGSGKKNKTSSSTSNEKGKDGDQAAEGMEKLSGRRKGKNQTEWEMSPAGR